jgi:hypothetical protein
MISPSLAGKRLVQSCSAFVLRTGLTVIGLDYLSFSAELSGAAAA